MTSTLIIDTHELGVALTARLSMDLPSDRPLADKLAHLRAHLRELGSLVVGFSAGVDSTFLLKVAYDELGSRCVALTAVSPSLPESERLDAIRIATSIGVEHVLKESAEIHNPKYRANPKSRCFYCKMALFDIAEDVKKATGIEHVAIGTNTDDLSDHRPGHAAAEQRGVLHPLVEAGFSKAEVREASRQLGLDVWNKAEFACLSSRFPYGTEITEARLLRVETCEEVLRDLDFKVFRVRYHDDLVRIELGEDELERAFGADVRAQIVRRCKAAGFKYVSLDLQGYRRGSMNE